MFSPNSVGTLAKRQGYDKWGQPTVSAAVECPYSQVTLKSMVGKTSVRADSSASRGQADEMTADATVLIAKFITPEIGDEFTADGTHYRIVSVFPRKTVYGRLDHWECDLEILP